MNIRKVIMIYNLDGMFETPEYRENTHLCLYNNNLYEDYPPHWHSPIEILMPVENSYTMVINNTSYEVKPYELFFIGPGVIHSTKAPETGQRYFFQIDISRLRSITGVNSILSFMGKVCHLTPESAPDIHRKLVKLFEEICDEYYNSEDFENPDKVAARIKNKSQDEAAHLMHIDSDEIDDMNKVALCEPIIYAKFLTMLTLIGRNHINTVETNSASPSKKKEYAGKFMSVCNYIDEHFAEDITLEEVAAKAGFSKFHFSRLFKQFTNISFYKYVNQQRIAHAEELLSDPDQSITQVAIQCGFSSTSSFIRMFKQFHNCTPTDFRKIRERYSFSSKIRIPSSVSEELNNL